MSLYVRPMKLNWNWKNKQIKNLTFHTVVTVLWSVWGEVLGEWRVCKQLLLLKIFLKEHQRINMLRVKHTPLRRHVIACGAKNSVRQDTGAGDRISSTSWQFCSFFRLFDKLSTYFNVLLVQGNIEILLFTLLFVKCCDVTWVFRYDCDPQEK